MGARACVWIWRYIVRKKRNICVLSFLNDLLYATAIWNFERLAHVRTCDWCENNQWKESTNKYVCLPNFSNFTFCANGRLRCRSNASKYFSNFFWHKQTIKRPLNIVSKTADKRNDQIDSQGICLFSQMNKKIKKRKKTRQIALQMSENRCERWCE